MESVDILSTHIAALSTTLTTWKDIKLDERRVEWDHQGLEIGNNQERSTEARRKLAEMTRNFKKTADDEKLAQVGAVMKGYQEEIDSLTRRSKFAENAFLAIYKLLYEAPDPAPLLAVSQDIASKYMQAEAEARKTSQELAHVTAELSTLQNQDLAVRRLEEKTREYELQMDERVKREADRRSAELREQFARTEATIKDRNLKYQLETTENTLMNTQRLYERAQAQIRELQERKSADVEHGQSESDLLLREMTSANEKIAALERERDALLLNADSTRSVSEDRQLQRSLAQKDERITDLLEQINVLDRTLAAERERHSSSMENLHADFSNKQRELVLLREKLDAAPKPEQYEDLKRQLRLLKAVQFNLEGDDDEPTGGPDAETPSAQEKSLTSLLVAKNRRLEDEITKLKMAVDDKSRELHLMGVKLTEVQSTNAKQAMLISKLESAALLLRRDQGSPTSTIRSFTTTLPTPATPLEPIPDLSESLRVNAASPPVARNDEPTMLDIVCGQRDRFKTRIAELETQLAQLQIERQAFNIQLDTVRSDNLKLFNKVKYLESYRGPQTATNGPSTTRGEVAIPMPDADVNRRYEPLYEQQMDPFKKFKKQEMNSRIKQLSVTERVALQGGRLMLSNKLTRNFLFFYALSLHVLVFLALYRLAHCGGA